MSLPFSAHQAELIAKAYTTGVETSIAQLSNLLGLDDVGILAAAREVIDFVEGLKLELVPPPDQGEFDSVRVLRVGSPHQDSLAEVQKLIAAGEGPSIEFKSSMLCSLREWEKSATRVEHASLPGEVLKTICAFMNSDGGDLLIGVNDEQSVCAGVRLDLELKGWNLDKWQLHFQSLVSTRFHEGPMISPYLRPQMINIGSEAVFHVQVMPRVSRTFVQREKGRPHEFFMRNGPRTDSLDLPTFYGHIMATSGNPKG